MKHLKSFALNVGVLIFSLFLVFLAERANVFVGLPNFQSPIFIVIGFLLIAAGTFVRTWASLTFYNHRLRILYMFVQHQLVKKGPYAWSRNPLYVGIVAITVGSALLVGSTMGSIFATLSFFFWDFYIRFFEEKNIEKKFGEEYRQYKQDVPRWFGRCSCRVH